MARHLEVSLKNWRVTLSHGQRVIKNKSAPLLVPIKVIDRIALDNSGSCLMLWLISFSARGLNHLALRIAF